MMRHLLYYFLLLSIFILAFIHILPFSEPWSPATCPGSKNTDPRSWTRLSLTRKSSQRVSFPFLLFQKPHFSNTIHQKRPAAPSSLLRTPWNRKNDRDSGRSSNNVHRQGAGFQCTGAERLGWPRNQRGQVIWLFLEEKCGNFRQDIITFAQTKRLHFDTEAAHKSQIKLVILDEADAMTKDAQNALRR